MADTKKAKKKTSKSGTTGTAGTSVRKKPAKKSSADTGEMISHLSEATQKQLKTLGEKLSSAKDKEKVVIMDIAEKVRQFANKATQLTKIKIDIHNLKEEHESLLKLMGENVWNMYKTDNLKNIKSKFTYDFERLKEVESELAEKEKTSSEITKGLKSIG